MVKTTFEIEILEDGTVKVLTGSIDGSAHMAAEQFLQFLSRELGGESVRTRRTHAMTHTHEGVSHKH